MPRRPSKAEQRFLEAVLDEIDRARHWGERVSAVQLMVFKDGQFVKSGRPLIPVPAAEDPGTAPADPGTAPADGTGS